MMNHAATSGFIMRDLDLPDNTVYNHLKLLKRWGVVEKCGQIIRRKGKGIQGGPRPDIYCIDKPSPDEIARCNSRYYKECNTGFNEITKVTQLIIEEYVSDEREVNYSDIFKEVKNNVHGYDPQPIVDEIAYNLHKLDVKVWR